MNTNPFYPPRRLEWLQRWVSVYLPASYRPEDEEDDHIGVWLKPSSGYDEYGQRRVCFPIFWRTTVNLALPGVYHHCIWDELSCYQLIEGCEQDLLDDNAGQLHEEITQSIREMNEDSRVKQREYKAAKRAKRKARWTR